MSYFQSRKSKCRGVGRLYGFHRYHIRKGGYGFLNRFFFGVAECKHDYLPDKYHLPSCSTFQSKRNWNRAVISRCFMLSSVSVLTCPFSRAAKRIRLL